MNQKQIDEVMELVEDWSMKDFLAADARLDPWSEHDPASPMCLQEKLDAEANSAKEAIRAKLVELAGWQPIDTAPKDVCTEFDGWNGERVTDVSWGWPEYHPKEKRCWIRAVYETGYGWITEEVHGLTHWMKKPEAPQ